MITSETISFIKQRLQNGATEETIKIDLLKSGHSEEEIKTAVDSAKDLIIQLTPVFQESKVNNNSSLVVALFAWLFALAAILFSTWYIYIIYKDGKAPDVIGEISKYVNQLKKTSAIEEKQVETTEPSIDTSQQ